MSNELRVADSLLRLQYARGYTSRSYRTFMELEGLLPPSKQPLLNNIKNKTNPFHIIEPRFFKIHVINIVIYV
jgi:hypothetical protein